VRAVVSRQVVAEAYEFFEGKRPEPLADFERVMKSMEPRVADDLPLEDVRKAMELTTHKEDAPILTAAVRAKVDYLVTWDTRHFKTEKVERKVSLAL